MMNTDENMPTRGTGKNGKAKAPAKKSPKRNRKPSQQEPSQQEPAQLEPAQQEPAQQAAPEPEQVEQAQEPVTVATVAMENPFTDTVPEAPAATAPAEHVEAASVNLQTITNAYGDFTRKSIEQTGSFFEQLAGARSLNKAFELQGAFAQQAYETFVAQSRRIRELHSELMMQRLRHLEGLVARMKPTRSS
jgi:hypothetical protein